MSEIKGCENLNPSAAIWKWNIDYEDDANCLTNMKYNLIDVGNWRADTRSLK